MFTIGVDFIVGHVADDVKIFNVNKFIHCNDVDVFVGKDSRDVFIKTCHPFDKSQTFGHHDFVKSGVEDEVDVIAGLKIVGPEKRTKREEFCSKLGGFYVKCLDCQICSD